MSVVQYEKVGILQDGEVFEWSIPGWILNHRNSTKRSDLFGHAHVPDSKFCLTLRPYGDSSTKTVSFSLQLHRIRVCGWERDSSEESLKYDPPEMNVQFILYRSNSVYRWSYSLKMQDNRLTADFPEISTYDSLRIQCIMIFNVSTPEEVAGSAGEESNGFQNPSDIREESCSLVHDMEALLSNGNLSDVTLCVEDQEFNVHRCILASRSDVFAAMFKHDTREKLENRIVIVDFSSEIIGQILKYIYTNKIEELAPEQYLSLFSAADKYAILDLRKKCSQLLQMNLPLKLLIHVLVAADLHQDDDLKQAAVQLFLNNAVSVMSSEEWLPFMKNHTELASSILMVLAKNSSGSSKTNRCSSKRWNCL